MRKELYILLSAVVVALSSCTHSVEPGSAGEIALQASVSEMSFELKSEDVTVPEAIPFEHIASDTPLDAKLLFSFKSGDYSVSNPDYGYTSGTDNPYCIPCHTNVSYLNDAFTFITYTRQGSSAPHNLKYPSPSEGSSTSADVYCVGLYPFKADGTEGWAITADGTTASHNVDGKTDLMFAKEIKGSWNAPFPAQVYDHLQTWLKVLVSASTIDAAQRWGKLTKITVKSNSAVNVSLNNAGNATSVSGGTGEQDMTVFESNEGKELDITSTQVGSLFVVPPVERASDADNTLVLKVKVHTTVFPLGKDVDVKLYNVNNRPITDPSYLAGKLFVMNLNFTPLKVIEGICTLNSWNALDEDLYLN